MITNKEILDNTAAVTAVAVHKRIYNEFTQDGKTHTNYSPQPCSTENK